MPIGCDYAPLSTEHPSRVNGLRIAVEGCVLTLNRLQRFTDATENFASPR